MSLRDDPKALMERVKACGLALVSFVARGLTKSDFRRNEALRLKRAAKTP